MMRICRHWGVAYLKSWDNYRPCNNLNLRTSLKTTFYTSMCWISTTKEETTAALNRCHRLAGELDKCVPRGERGEREELRHAPGPRLSQLHEHTHTQATFSILRGNYFNWKFYTALLTKFEGIMNSCFFLISTRKGLKVSYPWILSERKWGGKIPEGQWGAPWPPQSAVWASRTAEKDLLCQLHRTRTNPPLKRKSPKQVTEQNSTYATHERHICVWQGREVTILIPEKVDFRAKSISWEYFIMMRRAQCTKCFIKLAREKKPTCKKYKSNIPIKKPPHDLNFYRWVSVHLIHCHTGSSTTPVLCDSLEEREGGPEHYVYLTADVDSYIVCKIKNNT